MSLPPYLNMSSKQRHPPQGLANEMKQARYAYNLHTYHPAEWNYSSQWQGNTIKLFNIHVESCWLYPSHLHPKFGLSSTSAVSGFLRWDALILTRAMLRRGEGHFDSIIPAYRRCRFNLLVGRFEIKKRPIALAGSFATSTGWESSGNLLNVFFAKIIKNRQQGLEFIANSLRGYATNVLVLQKSPNVSRLSGSLSISIYYTILS